MEIVKKYIVGLVLLGIVAIIWVGMLFISDKIFSEVNPNATTYTKPLQQNFDLTTLEKITERTESSFPVLPSEFFSLDTN
ncbi:MAG: hypothetical protein WC981_00100 [Candidatus Dojkabacteria bacterium]|jgi:hypothetical protein